MKETTKQNKFTLDNIGLYHISPYCNVEVVGDRVYVYRIETDNGYYLSGMEKERLLDLIRKLIYGIEEEELVEYLENNLLEDSPFSWLEFCIQNGIVE